METPENQKQIRLLACVFLSIGIALVFGQTLNFSFQDLGDDSEFVSSPLLSEGLTFKGLRWTFSSDDELAWHPLTRASYLVTSQGFGLHPGAHHLAGVLLHWVNALLLLYLLYRTTGEFGRSVVVAALFGLHPIHVQAVAWVGARQHVLGGFFFMLTLLSYVSYAHHRGAWRYGLVVLAYGCALFADPLLLSLPVILVLFDFWPLKNSGVHWSKVRSSVINKIPLFGLGAAVAIFAGRPWSWAGEGDAFGVLGFPGQVGAVSLATTDWMFKAFYPVKLAIVYPGSGDTPAWLPSLMGIGFLVGLSLIALRSLRTRPYIAVGWFWFLVMAIHGIVIVGADRVIVDDRFAYVPLAGLCIMVVWGIGGAVESRPFLRRMTPYAVVALLVSSTALSYVQTRSWQRTLSLFQYAAQVYPQSRRAHEVLARTYIRSLDVSRAETHFLTAIDIEPENLNLRRRLGHMLFATGQYREAEVQYVEMVRLAPRNARCHALLARTSAARGKKSQALVHAREALRLDPSNTMAQAVVEGFE